MILKTIFPSQVRATVARRQLLHHRHFFSSEAKSAQKATSRIDRVHSRLPRFLQRYTKPLRSAPLTHVTAFLLLHELTAIVPLFGLAATFHFAQWLPPYISEGKYISQYVEKFGNYFRKKGWLGDEGAKRHKWWGRGEGTTRIIVELATAWAITKALLPLRLMVSVWMTPWFAKVAIVPGLNLFTRLFRRKTAAGAAGSTASGTGATGAGTAAVNSSAKGIVPGPKKNS